MGPKGQTSLCRSIWNLALKSVSTIHLEFFPSCSVATFPLARISLRAFWSSRLDIFSGAWQLLHVDSPGALAPVRDLIWGQRRGNGISVRLGWERVCREVRFCEWISWMLYGGLPPGVVNAELLVPRSWPGSPPAHWMWESGAFPLGLHLCFFQVACELVTLVTSVVQFSKSG